MMTDAGMSNADGGGAENGFFGNVTSTLSRTFDQFLPVWASSQLEKQSKDQLNQTTFNPVAAPPRNNDGMKSTTQTVVATATKNPMQTVMLVGGIAAVVIVAALLIKR